MTRYRRNREQAVSADHLAWVVTGPLDPWYNQTPTKEDIAQAHFENRQLKRDSVPELVSCDLRYVVEWPGCLQNVELERDYNDNPDLFRTLRCRKSSENTQIVSKSGGQIGDLERFEWVVNKLKYNARQLETENWLTQSVMYPLGPENITRTLQGLHNLEGYRHRLLVYNNNSSAILAVEIKVDEQQTRSRIERALGIHFVKKGSVVISAPNSGYKMYIKYGEKPVYVRNANESPLALIFDDKFDSKTGEWPKKFYGRLLNTIICSTRTLTDPEKRWLETRHKRVDLRNRTMRILEFISPFERNRAMKLEQVEHLDVLFCNSMFDCQEAFEELFFYIQYEMTPKDIECVAITLLHEEDKQFAESSFGSHGLTCYYFDDNCRKEPQLKYDPSVKTMVVQNFPRHMRTFESQKWFVERISKKNSFELEAIEPFVERVEAAQRTFSTAKTMNIPRVIEHCLYRIGHMNNIYRPINEPWIEQMQGGMGARCFLGTVRERADVPWRVTRQNEGAIENYERFSVQFKDFDTGIRFINRILRESYSKSIFKCDESDRVGPELCPIYRQSFGISRAVRVALAQKLVRFDLRSRKTFVTLMEIEDEMMLTEESKHFGVRVFEEWQKGSQLGVIGVHGWNPQGVRYFAKHLSTLLTPLEFSTSDNPELTFGIGEFYVRSLSEKYSGQVVVDIDKFLQKISVIGDCAEEAIKDLKNYSANKASINIYTCIPTHFPHMNKRIKELLTPDAVAALGRSLGLDGLFFYYDSNVIQFEGTILAYEMLMKAFDELNSEIFHRETKNHEGDIPNMRCPGCMTETGSSSDFYRFHCGHVVCRLCVNAMIKTNIEQEQLQMKCVDASCSRFIAPAEIMHIILGDKQDRILEMDSVKLRDFVRKSKDVLIKNDADNLKTCPTADCVGILSKSETSLDEPKKCETCHRLYCRQCLAEPHTGQSCEEHQRLLQPDASIQKYQEDSAGKVKECPKCGMLVEKRDGCNHVECQCKIHFCWVCLFFAEDSGKIYAHMTEEHGGHGGNYEIPELEDANIAMQEVLQAQIEPGNEEFEEMRRHMEEVGRLGNLNFFEDDQTYEDFNPVEQQDPLYRELVDLDRRLENMRPYAAINRQLRAQEQEARNRLIVNGEAPQHNDALPEFPRATDQVPQEAPGDINPQRPADEQPRAPQYLEEFPPLLLNIYPVFYRNENLREELLAWINMAETQEELDDRVADLFRFGGEPQAE